MSQKVINFGGRILVGSIYVRVYISGGEVKALANCPVIYICRVNSSGENFLKSLSVRKGSVINFLCFFFSRTKIPFTLVLSAD